MAHAFEVDKWSGTGGIQYVAATEEGGITSR